MGETKLKDFLSSADEMIVATIRESGMPQLTPVWYWWDGTSFYFSTTTNRAKYKNITKNSDIAVIINSKEKHQYVAAHGKAEILNTKGNESIVTALVTKYLPAAEQEKWEGLFSKPERVIIKLTPEKIVCN